MYSVDIDANALHNAAAALDKRITSTSFIESDSIAFLASFGQQIDFLYLDSYDFDINNPEPSQHHHLKEIEAAYPWLTENSVVMIDDCALPHGGKGKYIIQYLLDRGWKMDKKAYQVIMVKQNKEITGRTK